MTSAEAEVEATAVEAAAVALIDAFAKNDRPRYFAAFVPEATFVFPIVSRVLTSRADYEAEWQLWVDEDDFQVTECLSLDRMVQVYGDVAIFIHRTVTHSAGNSGPRTLHERETIIFNKVNGMWMATHEHVSPMVE